MLIIKLIKLYNNKDGVTISSNLKSRYLNSLLVKGFLTGNGEFITEVYVFYAELVWFETSGLRNIG